MISFSARQSSDRYFRNILHFDSEEWMIALKEFDFFRSDVNKAFRMPKRFVIDWIAHLFIFLTVQQ